MPVAPRITVSIGTRRVPVDEIADARLGTALRTAGLDIARKVAAIRCPVHKAAAKEVRIHFDPHGSADLQYDSCCEELGERIGKSLA
jgi:hypothetical protein